MPGTGLKIMLADDHALVRSGFHALLDSIDMDCEIVEAKSGKEVIEIVPEFLPDIVLMDIAMPDVDGLEATSFIKDRYPDIKVIILSMHSEKEYVAQALQHGANGYLLKDGELEELQIAIKVVLGGGIYLSPKISEKIIDVLSGKQLGDEGKFKHADRLTDRQKQVLELIANGKNTKEIAAMLSISPKTVEAHRQNIMKRLNIFDIPGLVRFTIREGIIDL